MSYIIDEKWEKETAKKSFNFHAYMREWSKKMSKCTVYQWFHVTFIGYTALISMHFYEQYWTLFKILVEISGRWKEWLDP